MEKSDISPTTTLAPRAASDEQVKTAANAAPAAQIEKKRTVGNLVYDFGVFGSVAWAGVAIVSALSAHESRFGNNKYFGWLRTLNDKSFHGLKNFLSRNLPKTVSEKKIEGYAKGTTLFLTLGMGGNALMAPVKWLEDHRQSNAARIDHALGTTPPDPALVEAEPKQTWKSVLSGRLLSWGTSYAAFLAMGPKISDDITEWFGKKSAARIGKIFPHADPKKIRRWTDIAAFDSVFTVITAAITYTFSRYIAKKDGKKLSGEDQVMEVNPANPTVLEKVSEDPAAQHEPQKQFAPSIKPRPNLTELPPELYTVKATSDKSLERSLA